MRTLPESWELVEDGAGLLSELRAEVGHGHPLYGLALRVVARSNKSDDLLCEVLDGSARLAEVHLTWAQHPEPDLQWPAVRFFANERAWQLSAID